MRPLESPKPSGEPFDCLPALTTLGLSRQQQRVVALICEGLGDKQIAAAMGIGFSTVRTYLERIFARLQVGDRKELLLHVFSLSRKLDGAGVPINTDSKITDSKITDSNVNDSRNTDLFSSVQKPHSEGRRRGIVRVDTVSASRPPKASSLRNRRERQKTAVDREAGHAGE